MTSHDLSGPGLAVVTGASTGIGRAFASLLAGEGYDLVLAADEPEVHAVADNLESTGRTVTAVEVDLAARDGVERLHEVVASQPSPVSVGILNAGIGVHGRFDQAGLDEQLRLVDLNVRSTVHLSILLARDMVAQQEGRLLLVSSIAGKGPGPGHAAYAASKAFVHSFAEAIRHELADTGVSVTSLQPGPTDTDFFDRADMGATRVAQGPKDTPEEVANDGWRALLAGKDHVVAGSVRNTVQAAGAHVVPDPVAAKAAARQTEEVSER
ncbi:short-subunit dehydrogenase [Nocardioides cavernae]|uniref:Short-subunit dehydrogenase n=1 Tax=Nocardioides cavernae TaxID=1921566 RepID=A0A7Y9H2I3_9ACTN|nr:SDR family NAD(P)-dependent oxidoreductase [Nocardioides cavernae]NYE36767.1 short-subunit dehydrogenase [Nocardioides cavernae]